MVASLVLGLSLSGACGGQPPAPGEHRAIPPLPDFRAIDNARLKTVRGRIRMFEQQIKQAEEIIELLEPLLCSDPSGQLAANTSRMKRHLIWERDYVEELREEERQLIAGGATMPLPRAPSPHAKPRID
jgi:hypothetical protein